MVSFAGESEQSTGGCIPEDSVCMFRMEVRQPTKPEKKTQDAFVSKTATGVLYLDCVFEVVSGKYEGRKIFELLALPKGEQVVQLTEGQTKWTNGCGAKMRAIVEAVRRIDPKDQSSNAMNGRAIAGWHEFNGMMFPIKVGYKKIEDNDQYVNNRIKSIITPNRSEYEVLINGGEVITDNPIPVIAQQTQQQPQQSGGYGGYNQQYNMPPQGEEDLGPAFPSEATGMDDVPF